MSKNARLPSLDKLGKELRMAAEREMRGAPSAQQRPPRRSRRILIALVGASLLAAGAAGAGELLSTGEPDTAKRQLPENVDPARAGDEAAVVVRDPETSVEFAARAFTTPDGARCVLVGQRKGGTLGIVRDDEFVPYGSTGGSGVCAPFGSDGVFVETSRFREPRLRTVVFGRARSGIEAVSVRVDGRRHRARTGPGGAFILLFDREVSRGNVSVRAVD